MRGCRKERSPAGRPDNNAGHAEWSLHPHAHRAAVGTEKPSVGTALPNAGFHLNGAITALPNSDKGIFAEHLIRRLGIVRHLRSDESSVGKEWISTCRSWWLLAH